MVFDHQRGDGGTHQTLAASSMEVEALRTVGNSVIKCALGMMHVPWRCLDSICHAVASANQEADGQKILRRKCCKPSVELIEGLFGARVRVRLSWMMTPHHLRTVDQQLSHSGQARRSVLERRRRISRATSRSFMRFTYSACCSSLKNSCLA